MVGGKEAGMLLIQVHETKWEVVGKLWLVIRTKRGTFGKGQCGRHTRPSPILQIG